MLVQGLDVLYDDLVTMEMMVYECNVEEGFTLRHLQQMPDIDRLRLMMSKVSFVIISSVNNCIA